MQSMLSTCHPVLSCFLPYLEDASHNFHISLVNSIARNFTSLENSGIFVRIKLERNFYSVNSYNALVAYCFMEHKELGPGIVKTTHRIYI